MKARITYRKKCIKKHNRTSFIAAVVVVLSIGLAVGSYRGHIQKENEKKIQEIAQELQKGTGTDNRCGFIFASGKTGTNDGSC